MSYFRRVTLTALGKKQDSVTIAAYAVIGELGQLTD